MRHLTPKRFFVAIAMVLLALPALAQDTAEEEKSFFVSFLENQLSTPDRQIRISNIQGVLSSSATIGEITVADRRGVWLRIVNASIDWSRTALILRQRLEIARLAAENIEIMRRPLPREGLPSPEARSFRVPELPIAVNLERLEVSSLEFSRDVFGLQSEISVEGSLRLEGGSLDTSLAMERLDGPGGQLNLAAGYANETQVLHLDLSLSEPANGVVANLLKIPERPSLALTLQGSGPVENLDLDLALQAAGEQTLSGTAQFRRRDQGLGFTTELSGEIARLVAPQYRAFFGSETALSATGVVLDTGGFRLHDLRLTSAALALQASAETSADRFLTGLALEASIADGNGGAVVLPLASRTTVQRANLSINYGQAGSNRWSGRLDIAGLTTGTFAAETVALDMGGAAEDLQSPDQRRITFDVGGGVTGIDWRQEKVAEALGNTIRLDVEGGWRAGQPLLLETARLEGNGLSLALSGEIANYAFNGDISLNADSIAPFSALAGRGLSGAAGMTANGRVEPVTGAFNLQLDGRANELRIGRPAVDNLLAGITTISGRLARGEDGLKADDLRVTNDQFELAADGTFATGEADFDFNFTLTDLALVSDKASGRLTATGRAAGQEGRIALTFSARVPEGRLVGKALADAVLGFNGTLQDENLTGRVTGTAELGGVSVRLSSAIAVAGGERRLSGLDFSAGRAQMTGDLVQNADGLFEGELSVAAPDISTAAALLLTEASGSLNADINLNHSQGQQNAEVSAHVRNLRVQATRIGSAGIEATIEDLFGVPLANGTINASDVAAAGIAVRQLNAEATRSGRQTAFTADAVLDNGVTLSSRGSLAAQGDGFVLALDQAEMARAELGLRLRQRATIRVDGQDVSFDAIELDIGGGSLTARGRVAESFDVSLDIRRLPLAVANSIRPDLRMGGTIDGTATITGPRNTPQINFEMTGRQIAAAALASAGLNTITIAANGSTSGETLTLDLQTTSPEGLRASARGDVPLDDGHLALDVGLDAFPVALLNAVAKGQDLSGNISGSARVTGTLASPRAAFELRGSNLNAAQLSRLGLGPLQATANGSFADRTLALSSLGINGPSGLSLTGSGRVPLGGGGLMLNASGSIPLSAANSLLAERGTAVSGAVSFNARVTGSMTRPAVDGTFSVANAQLVDPQSNLRLDSIRASGSISGTRVTVSSATAALAAGGSVALSGAVSIDAGAGFPADLRIALDNARYLDGEMLSATVSGALRLAGPLRRDPVLSGNVDVQRAEIIVPSSFSGGAAAIDVEHVAPPQAVLRTLERARADDGTPMPSARPSVLRLDVTINAPARVFVRGRGLDAELGGSVRLTGPVTDIRPVGGLELIRGRLSILGQRIDFDEGKVTLVGDLDPFVDFVARSSGADITVFITVRGRVTDLDISFSSQPELPEDEVLARLIFDRGIDELSPLQLARLAAAAAELAGGSNSSLLNDLRGATGLDDLDIVTTGEGGAAVRAGRYIQDNIYLGVEAGSQGTTRGTINLDITQELKAKGSVGSDGNSTIGIFYEKDY